MGDRGRSPGELRVLQVALSLDPGGTERLVIDIARRLNGRAPTAVCCLDVKGAWAAELESIGIAVTALGRGDGFTPRLGGAVAGAAAAHRASVLHCHHYSPFVYGCLARLWSPGLRIVFTEHGRLSDAPPSPKRQIANRMLQHVPTTVVAVSDDLRRHMIAEGFSKSRVGVVYNGIDVTAAAAPETRDTARAALVLPAGAFVIGTVARLDPVKDLGTLIAAVARLPRELSAVLLVIGDGPERARLEAASRDAGVSDRVRFLGHRGDARQLLAACDAYVNSSISEGISLTILEAMAARLPVVVTRVGGTPEIVDDSCARLVAARDPDALAAALHDLARQPDLRSTLGGNARIRVETRFNLDRMVDEYYGLYRQAVA